MVKASDIPVSETAKYQLQILKKSVELEELELRKSELLSDMQLLKKKQAEARVKEFEEMIKASQEQIAKGKNGLVEAKRQVPPGNPMNN
jgi:hypothetical protein